MKTYDQMHSGLHWARGRASEHLCFAGCGRTARDWAYMHNAKVALVEEGRPYSEDFSNYEPMCRSCHLKMDLARDPSWAQRVGRFGSGSENERELRSEWARRGREAVARMPRRKCVDCGMVSNQGGMGTHLKATSHTGYEVVVAS